MRSQLDYSPAEGDGLRLVEVTADNYLAVLRLEVTEEQRQFVASNAVSLVQGHYHDTAWFRAVYEGDQPVGFVKLHDPRCEPAEAQGDAPDSDFDPAGKVADDSLFIWRLMIGEGHQGRGLGRRAVAVLADLARRNGFSHLCLSYVEGEGGPGPFYEACGFVRSGRVIDGEIEACLDLSIDGS
ncbi:GNAT family N-acetyltransferase [Pelagibius sp.]|uniref:GNAT family N-acetyltransferase n=1 Tax=Pelagibius sp. TaxID=1931238 RepID=UPI00261F0D0A|nr:GNAT family N-acetyltransferase [Pelagibius sp.]